MENPNKSGWSTKSFFSSVDFPTPDGPQITTTSFESISSEIGRTQEAHRAPKFVSLLSFVPRRWMEALIQDWTA